MDPFCPGVLLVEDNDLDAEKVIRAFAKIGVARPVTRARNGIEALDVLRRHTPVDGAPPHYVVLLDLNMPCMNGIEFLEELRTEERFASTPVFVLTTSGREVDVSTAHRHHISGYLVKPLSMAEMIETLRAANSFWAVCRIPHRAA